MNKNLIPIPIDRDHQYTRPANRKMLIGDDAGNMTKNDLKMKWKNKSLEL